MCQHALTASDIVMWAPEMKDKTPCKEQNTGFKEAGGLQRICLLFLDLLYSDTSVLYLNNCPKLSIVHGIRDIPSFLDSHRPKSSEIETVAENLQSPPLFRSYFIISTYLLLAPN